MPPTAPVLACLAAHFPQYPHYLARVQTALASLDALPDELPSRSALLALAQPVRFVQFPIPWVDDAGHVQINQGYIINYVNLNPAPCDLCIQPGLTADDALARGFSALLENALSGHIGSCFVGADGDVHAMSRRESLAFCQRLAASLHNLCPCAPILAGAHTSLPLRELGYLLGQQEALLQRPCCPPQWPLLPQQAAGYGLCYFIQAALQGRHSAGLDGKTVLVSGTGVDAVYAAQKATQMGAHVVALGGTDGYLAAEKLDMVTLKALLDTPLQQFSVPAYHPDPEGLWDIPADVVLLCDPALTMDTPLAQRLLRRRPEAAAASREIILCPEAQVLLEAHGTLFCPALAAGSGAALLRTIEPHLSAWDADKRLRASMRGLYKALSAAHAPTLTHAAHITALEHLSTALLTRGLV